MASPPDNLSAWHSAWDNARPRLSEISEALSSTFAPTPRITRVGQLDSELLDQELVQLLKEPIAKAFGLIHARFDPELELLLQLALYKLSVWQTGASYGAKLQGLRYAIGKSDNSHLTFPELPRRILLLHGTLTVLVPYLHNRIRAYALSHTWPDAPSSDNRRKAWEFLTRLESTHNLLALLNFIAFLCDGRFRTIADRLLNMRLIPSSRLVKRDVSYEFMNRQMVWHAFTEFLLFLLPLINTRALRRRITTLISRMTLASILPAPLRQLTGLNSSDVAQGPKSAPKGKYWALSADQCAICAENASMNLNLRESADALAFASSHGSSSEQADPELNEDAPAYPINTPYVTSCGHIYCYYCLSERMMSTSDERSGVGTRGTQWECLRCCEGVTGAERVEVEVGYADSSEEMDFDFGSEDMDFTDGSIGTYSESGVSE